MSAAVPGWLAPLADAAASIGGDDLSRFLPPDDGSGRPSAVLISFADGPDGPSVLLIERSSDLRKHAGQVAFPGGSIDDGDASPVAAALREATEEVGLDAADVQVIAALPPIFIPVTGFVVTPVLAWCPALHDPAAVRAVSAAEVARVELVPIAELTDPSHRFLVNGPAGYLSPGFEARGLFVWGFTAGLLDRLLDIAGWAQPWDRTVRRPLPPLPGYPSPPTAAVDRD
ncbi:NUDIX hydrolase [uncultured Jatrophihabitans sp.]|uniref:NUDIX hydrolase n=1 Tax=uncultured Jatrophihabitans sp. TaxID=1610747 RepID=UPI0035CC3745